MLHRTAKTTVLGALTAATLLLTACGAGAGADSLEDVAVEGATDAQPEVSFDTPLEIGDTTSAVVRPGDGETVKEGQQVTANMTLVSGESGEIIESSYEADTPAGFPMDTSQINQSLFDALIDVPVGSRVLMTLNGAATQGAEEETLLYVIDITGVEDVLTRAEGEEQDLPEGMPELTRGDDGAPSITQPEGDAPTELQTHVAIKGEGEEVRAGDTTTVHYTGWLWDDASEPFDSSWDRGQPFPVEGVGQAPVIDGWNEALQGQTVGSQILVVIPPEKGYGEEGSGESIPPNSTLVFVIDILKTTR
ncbi:FKBP-type peptidyl-prolyl cis-trans isomerase [Brevibacterium litoralis]|uniref:FKBP-type peptidyl-prolyl cis-trans isomerase n=1 Tax=Brevibacterium litoralis TaxID=3138935 RepID=UPI0032EFA833